MATSMSSYGILVPEFRHLFLVNAEPDGDILDGLIVIDPSPDLEADMFQVYEGPGILWFDDELPPYTTTSMEFTTNNGSVATARFLNGSLSEEADDNDLPMRIARFIVSIESLGDDIDDDDDDDDVLCEECINAGIVVKMFEKSKEEEEEEGESVICVICQEEYEGDEMIGTLKCGHGYHENCIKDWLVRKNVCPICRSKAF